MLSSETDGDKDRVEKWFYSRIKIEVVVCVIPHRHCYYYCYCYCVCYYFHCLEGVSQTKSCWSASRVLIEVIAAIICTSAVCNVIGMTVCNVYCTLYIVVVYVCVFLITSQWHFIFWSWHNVVPNSLFKSFLLWHFYWQQEKRISVIIRLEDCHWRIIWPCVLLLFKSLFFVFFFLVQSQVLLFGTK